MPQDQLTPIINKVLNSYDLEDYNTAFVALFFDLVEPNLEFNKNFTEKVVQDQLRKIAYTRGSIARETLIVSKGEVVEGDKYQILKCNLRP